MRVAALDCGTNATRMLVADATPTGLDEVTRRLLVTRMGEGVDATGVLREDALRRVRTALGDYVSFARELGVERIGVLATSAARDARNTDDLIRVVEDATGVRPLILTGDEEAAATYAGAVAGLAVARPVLVVDLGGGSTEFAVEVDGQLVAASLDVGSVRLRERILRADSPAPEHVAAAVSVIDATLAAVPQRLGIDHVATVVAVGGTALTLTALQRGLADPDDRRLHGASLTRTQIDQLAEDLVFAPSRTIAKLPVITPGREDVIGAGALILSRALWLLDAPALVASRHDLLDDLARRLAAPTPSTPDGAASGDGHVPAVPPRPAPRTPARPTPEP